MKVLGLNWTLVGSKIRNGTEMLLNRIKYQNPKIDVELVKSQNMLRVQSEMFRDNK